MQIGPSQKLDTQGQDSRACFLFSIFSSVGVLKWAKSQVIAAADFVWSWEDVVRWGYLEPESAKKTMLPLLPTQAEARNPGMVSFEEF